MDSNSKFCKKKLLFSPAPSLCLSSFLFYYISLVNVWSTKEPSMAGRFHLLNLLLQALPAHEDSEVEVILAFI
jgi:hypothetical protein